MKQKLDIKRIFRVALVDKGDNPEAEVVIHKRLDKTNPSVSDVHMDTTDALFLCANCNKKSSPDANGMCKKCGKPMVMKATSFAQLAMQSEVLDDFGEMTDMLSSAIYSAMYDDTVTDKQAAIKQSIDEFAAALKGKLDMPMEKTEKVGLLKQVIKAFGLGEGDVEIPPVVETKETPVDKKDETVVDDVAKAEIETLRKQLADTQKVADENAANFAKLQEEREVEQFSKQAAGFAGVPGITAEFGKILRKISKALTAEEFAVVDSALKGASELIAQSEHFKEIGKGAKAVEGAEAEIDAAAQAYMKADPKLTREMAVSKVMKEQPELYNKYRAEQNTAGQNA